MSQAAIIILIICLINAGATLALWSTADQTADSAQQAAEAALKVSSSNERLIKLRIDQTCMIDERNNRQAPAFCDEPGVGLPEK